MNKKRFFTIIVSITFACIFAIYPKSIIAQESSLNEGMSKININTASQEQFEQIKGIGPGLAKKIIEYRESHGNFEKVEDLINVKGIGEKKLEKMKDIITISEENSEEE